MTQRILLGMLTPSSNTTLEPVTAAMLDDLPKAITIFCTNLRGVTVVWTALRLAGADLSRVRGWGRLFREVA